MSSLLHVLTRRMAALLFVIPLLGFGPEKPIVPAKDPAELEARITKILKEHKVPGMCAVIADRNGLVWTAGMGQADVATGKRVTPDTLFRIGSISKAFVGLAALKLVEEGRLDLNATVRSLVPEVKFTNRWEAADPVRVVHLLEHTAGWDDLHFKEIASNDPKPTTLAEGLAIGPESRISRWKPGTRFSYCNSGPAVAAAIIEKVTSQRFEDYVAETFFKPIGMNTADYFYSPRTQSLLTKLYHEDGLRPFPYWHFCMRPAGAINASAREMGSCLRFFLRRGEIDGQRILSEASIRRMETPTTYWGAQGGMKTGYGLNNYSTLDDRGFVWHGHNGGVEGGLSSMAYLPEQGLGYFLSINSGSGTAFMELMKQVKAFVTRDLPESPLPPSQVVPASIAREFQGWYSLDSSRNQSMAFLERAAGVVHITFKGDRMVLKSWFAPADSSNLAVGGRMFRDEHEGAESAVMLDTSEGRVIQTTQQTLIRVSPFRAWLTIVLTICFLVSFLSVPLFALVWGTRWLFRRMRGVPNLHVRLLPLLAVFSLLAVILIFILLGDGFLTHLGHRTVWSMGLCAASWAFAIFSFASLWAVLRAKRQGMNRWAYYHSLAVSVSFVITTLYLAYWGMIGIRLWA